MVQVADTTKLAMKAALNRAHTPLSESERQCGGCTLCCTLLPVVALKKEGGKRCVHQRSLLDKEGAGCAVYRRKGFPGECGLWACRWLVDPTTSALPRPDSAHYVIDIVPDFITAHQGPGGPEVKLPVIQVWCDPRYPDAHRDPKLREWIANFEPECGVLVRYSERDAIFLIPPHMSDKGIWEERGDGPGMLMEDRTHRADEVAAVLHQSRAMK
jgi:hypothetical protein